MSVEKITEKVIETDVLVIGGGIAGFTAAIRAKQLGVKKVTLVDKAHSGKSGASCLCGGSTGVDNPEWDDQTEMGRRKQRCIRYGEYVNNLDWYDTVFGDSWARIQDLSSWGVPFIKNYGGDLPQGQFEPARWADGWDESGTFVRMKRRKITPPLKEKALKDGIVILDRVMVTELLTREEKVIGAVGFHAREGDFYKFIAKATVLAAGSSGLKHIGTPRDYRTGEGEMMAYRAGAELTSREFGGHGGNNCTEYPAAFYSRGAAQIIKHWSNGEGEINFLERYGQVGPYSGWRIASAWAWEVDAGRGPIYWDLDQATDEEIKRVDGLLNRQKKDSIRSKWGCDVRKGGKVGWVEANNVGNADKGQGGIRIKHPTCETNLPGLYAAGDSAGTMYWGAEVCGMAVTGLVHAVVTGYRAGESAATFALKADKPVIDEKQVKLLKEVVYAPILRKGGYPHIWVTQCIQCVSVPYYMFHVKSAERLEAALTMCKFIQERLIPKLKAKDIHELRMCNEVRNMGLNLEVMIRSSLFRTESRGMHYREDYPRRVDPEWLAWTVVKKGGDGEMTVYKEPIPKKWWPDLTKSYEEIYDWRHPDNVLTIEPKKMKKEETSV